MELIRVENIYKSFGTTPVLNNVCFALKQAEFGCLLGSSGSGKSTLLRIIAGLEVADKGEVNLGGTLMAGENIFVKPEKRNIGMIFQDYALFPHLTVKQNIYFGANKNTQLTQIEKLIQVLGLETLQQRYPHQLSGGQQQRVAIARSMAVNPQLLLMDEPFSNLDEWMKEDVRDELRMILQELKTTVLFVTHHAADALSFADKIMVMDGGNIVQEGTAEMIIGKPVSAKIAGIFGKVNVFTASDMQRFFGIEKQAGHYFVKPEHFETNPGDEWLVMNCVFQGAWYDVNLKQNERNLHVHLPVFIEPGTRTGIKPMEKFIFKEQL
ncbi:MAG TPA: ABC transporter ATP-binding protein [Flavobacteriales bacterium]|nr:ABC transporter ATP-binding protein [Flavobacteriales bacterium]